MTSQEYLYSLSLRNESTFKKRKGESTKLELWGQREDREFQCRLQTHIFTSETKQSIDVLLIYREIR
jgi:hypothetical protein